MMHSPLPPSPLPRGRRAAAPLDAATLALVLGALFTLASLTACHRRGGPGTYSGAGPVTAAWQDIPIPGTQAAARMPSAPQWQYERGHDADGAQVQRTYGMTPFGGQAAFSVVVVAVQGSLLGRPIEALAALHREFAEGDGREQRSFAMLEEHGYTGFDGQYVDTQRDVAIFVRAFVGRQRTYTYMAFVQTQAVSSYQSALGEFFRGARPDASDAPFVPGDGVLREDAWQWVYPPITGFAAEFPGAPRMMEYPSTFEDATFKRSYAVAGPGGAAFEVRATGFQESTPDDALERIEAPPEGYTLRRAMDSTRQGFPARVLVYESPARLRFHVHVKTARRLLEASVDLPRESGQRLLPARERFFNHFRVN